MNAVGDHCYATVTVLPAFRLRFLSVKGRYGGRAFSRDVLAFEGGLIAAGPGSNHQIATPFNLHDSSRTGCLLRFNNHSLNASAM